MPPVPEWLAKLFREFPVATLVFVACWLTYRAVRAGCREELAREERVREDVCRRADDEIARAWAEKEKAERLAAEVQAKLDRANADHNRYVRSQQRAAEKRARREDV